MTVCFECLVPVQGLKLPALKALICRILEEESCPGCDLTVILTDSAHLRRLNRRYRGKDKVTDVISFAMVEGPQVCWSRPNLGDVYISLPRARRQAKEYCATIEDEIKRLTVHGVLHLLGFDHIQPGPASKMRRREEIYLYG